MLDADGQPPPLTREGWERALQAEPQLARVEDMVRIQVMYIRDEDEFCYGCYWERVLKPACFRLVGMGRGVVEDRQAADPVLVPEPPRLRNFSEIPLPRHTRATTETEEWMRSRFAWDAVTDWLLSMVYAVDRGNGHGFARNEVDGVSYFIIMTSNREYDSPDFVGPFHTAAEADAWLNPEGNLRREVDVWYEDRIGCEASVYVVGPDTETVDDPDDWLAVIQDRMDDDDDEGPPEDLAALERARDLLDGLGETDAANVIRGTLASVDDVGWSETFAATAT